MQDILAENQSPVELLAPAGNMTALHAAIAAGADAVYLGLDSFNARRNAENFTLETLGEACDFAHLRGASVYVALNIVVLPDEMDAALECARQAWRAGADAFIVQDIGLAAQLARTLPQARLHISTQMNTLDLNGLAAAARLGAKRVTLGRELSLCEITILAQAAREMGMEVEAFVHGALCICYSGQCFMSSMIGGRSANRGLCAQACRLPYQLIDCSTGKAADVAGEHLLSPKDLSGAPLLPELVAAGVTSLKIEGRMKSAEYVSGVVATYRQLLDREAARSGSGAATVQEEERLAESFSRGFTTAYLEGQRGNDIMSYQRPNNRGVPVGKVAAVKNGRISFKPTKDLAPQDVIEFWTRKGHEAYTLSEDDFDKGGALRPLPVAGLDTVRAGDRVFRVRSAKAAFEDDAFQPRIPLDCSVNVQMGCPVTVGFQLALDEASSLPAVQRRILWRLVQKGLGSVSAEAAGPVIEPARSRPLDEEGIRAHVDRLGQTPFSISGFQLQLDEGAGLGFSALHHVRADALDLLADALLAPYKNRLLPKIQKEPQPRRKEVGKCTIAVWATNPVNARAAKRAGADEIIVPLLNYRRGTAQVAGQVSSTVESAGYPKQITLALPVVHHEACDGSREGAKGDPANPESAAIAGASHLFVESLGGLQTASETDAEISVGPHLPLCNRRALEAAAEFGASRAWLSPELTLAQIKQLGEERPLELGLTVIGNQELMTCEHCLLMSQGPCGENCESCPRRKSLHVLRDRKGYEFPVVTDELGRSHLYNAVQLDIVPDIPSLLASGITAFMIDAALMNGEETAQAVGRVKRALRVAQSDGNSLAKMPDTTSGHLHRGVS